MLAVLVASISALMLATGPSVPAHAAVDSTPDGSIGIRLLEIPAEAADDPRALLYIVDHVQPGTVIERRMLVANSTDQATAIDLYAAAATVQDGVFQGADGRSPNDLSTWTSVSDPRPVLAAGGEQIVTVTIAVPSDAAPGEQYGAVWAETSSTTETGVTAVNRVGIRLYLSVGPGGAPAADFTVDSLTATRSDAGQPTVLAVVRNTGGRALDLVGELTLTGGPGGLSAGPFPAVLGTTVGIGDDETVTIVLDEQIPAGPWNAQLTLRSGLLERSVSASITFPEAGSAAPVETSTWPTLRDVLLISAVLVLLAMLTVMILVRRRRSKFAVAA